MRISDLRASRAPAPRSQLRRMVPLRSRSRMPPERSPPWSSARSRGARPGRCLSARRATRCHLRSHPGPSPGRPGRPGRRCPPRRRVRAAQCVFSRFAAVWRVGEPRERLLDQAEREVRHALHIRPQGERDAPHLSRRGRGLDRRDTGGRWSIGALEGRRDVSRERAEVRDARGPGGG